MSVGDRFCYRCYSWNCLCMELYRRDGPFFWFWNASIPDDKLTMTVGSDDDLDTLWQLRLTLTEIAWMARCISLHDQGYTTGQWHMSHLIGTGGDTK